MGYYVEVHCDVRRAGRDPKHQLSAFCWTDRNDNPQGWSIAAARAAAKRAGWKINRNGDAACPNCRKPAPTKDSNHDD